MCMLFHIENGPFTGSCKRSEKSHVPCLFMFNVSKKTVCEIHVQGDSFILQNIKGTGQTPTLLEMVMLFFKYIYSVL